MGIAPGGAATSSVLCAWFAVTYAGVGGPIPTDFLIYNLILVALNGRLLLAMWGRKEWGANSWVAAVALFWLWVQLLFIQVPILFLLRAASSRQWFEAEETAAASA